MNDLSSNEQVGGNHYKNMAIDPMTYCLLNEIPYFEGNIIKYVTRWRKKDGIQDLKKAQHYLSVLIRHEEAKVMTPWPTKEVFVPGTPEDGGHHSRYKD